MANCPVCSVPLKDDFGLVDCPRCGTSLFVEFDGTVRRRAGQTGSSLEKNAPGQGPEAEGGPNTNHFNFNQEGSGIALPELSRADATKVIPVRGSGEGTSATALTSQETNAGGGGPSGLLRRDTPSGGDEAATAMSRRPTSAALSAAPTDGPGAGIAVSPENFEDFPAEIAPQVLIPPPPVVTPGLSDLSAFGNSEASTGREGPYLYDLMVSGIDTADVREAVREALADPLFVWDFEPLLRSISDGELRLERVPAVKASLVVYRLSHLPLEIKWVQHAVVAS